MKVDKLLHTERRRTHDRQFRKWLWKARTSEHINSGLFFASSTAKKAKRVRYNSCQSAGRTTHDTRAVAESAATHFEGAFSEEIADMSYLSELKFNKKPIEMERAFSSITIEEVNEALGWLSNSKTPGIDGIKNEMLKLPRIENRDCRRELAEILTHFFNNITRSGKFPAEWKRSIIIPAYKKGDSRTLDTYRPISLLSSLSKVYTRLLNKRVSLAAENCEVFNETQGGGRSMRDIREKFSIIRGIVDDANRRQRQLYLLLPDISKAFDSVPHNAIRTVYDFFGYPDNITKLVTDMVSNNEAQVLAGQLSRPFKINKGTRQGDSLSPTTYILVHQTVLMFAQRRAIGYQALSQKIWNIAYVDDCNIVSESKEAIERIANDMSGVLEMLRMQIAPNAFTIRATCLGPRFKT